jgi:hypothetical protein
MPLFISCVIQRGIMRGVGLDLGPAVQLQPVGLATVPGGS